MITQFIMNHLWQSSCFALFAGLLAFMLRKNSPKVRYWIWLSSSLKFLVPFSLLVSLGSVVPRSVSHAASVPNRVIANSAFQTAVQIADPYPPSPYVDLRVHAPMPWGLVAIGIVWSFGFL